MATYQGEYPLIFDAVMSMASGSAALSLWLAFFPPPAYRRWLAAGAGDAAR